MYMHNIPEPRPEVPQAELALHQVRDYKKKAPGDMGDPGVPWWVPSSEPLPAKTDVVEGNQAAESTHSVFSFFSFFSLLKIII